MLLITYEDRPTDLVALKLLALSLQRHCPDLTLRLYCPVATPAFEQWIARIKQVQFHRGDAYKGIGHNIKPTLILDALNHGHDQVIWLDSDMIFTGDFRSRLPDQLDQHTLVGTQEVYWGVNPGSIFRTMGQGFTVGRALPYTLNSCFVRFTQAHRELLEDWRSILTSEHYLTAQGKPWRERPGYMIGDQDCLNALLGSTWHTHIPVHLLRRGVDIIQNGGPAGYTLAERLTNLKSGNILPPIVHTQGLKPWLFNEARPFPADPRAYYERLYLELSPYTAAARSYQHLLEEDAPWMNVRTLIGRGLQWMTRSEPTLQGLPVALLDTLMRRIKRATLSAKSRMIDHIITPPMLRQLPPRQWPNQERHTHAAPTARAA